MARSGGVCGSDPTASAGHAHSIINSISAFEMTRRRDSILLAPRGERRNRRGPSGENGGTNGEIGGSETSPE